MHHKAIVQYADGRVVNWRQVCSGAGVVTEAGAGAGVSTKARWAKKWRCWSSSSRRPGPGAEADAGWSSSCLGPMRTEWKRRFFGCRDALLTWGIITVQLGKGSGAGLASSSLPFALRACPRTPRQRPALYLPRPGCRRPILTDREGRREGGGRLHSPGEGAGHF